VSQVPGRGAGASCNRQRHPRQIQPFLTAKGAKIAKVGVGDADNFGFWMASEVDQQTEFKTSCFQVVQKLGFMLWGNIFDRLQLDNDFAVADKIRLVGLGKLFALVLKNKLLLGL